MTWNNSNKKKTQNLNKPYKKHLIMKTALEKKEKNQKNN